MKEVDKVLKIQRKELHLEGIFWILIPCIKKWGIPKIDAIGHPKYVLPPRSLF
jgi:hypothetical protein